MLLPLHAVEEVCGIPLAGVRSVALIDPDDLSVQPKWYFPGLVSELVFKPGRAAYAFPLIGLKASLADNTPSTEQGDFFEYDFNCTVKGVTPGMELLRQKLINRKIHLDVTYGDRQRRLLPNIRLFAKGSTGNRGGNPQGYSFAGKLQLTRPAPFTDATFAIIGPPYVPPEPDPGGSGGTTVVTQTTSGSTHVYTVPSGSLLVAIEVVAGGSAQTPAIGFSPGASDIGGPIDLAPGQTWVCAGLQVPSVPTTNIYFSGLDGTNTLRIWLLES